jgi:hypothetical protein
VLPDPNETHIVPAGDLRDHDTSVACWCRPFRDEECHSLIIHNSMDGRELYERGERKPS